MAPFSKEWSLHQDQSDSPSTAATATAYPNPPPQIAYTYDLADRLTAIASVSGSTTSFGIDALGRHASQTANAGVRAYNAAGVTVTNNLDDLLKVLAP